jgi:hypothetical protein
VPVKILADPAAKKRAIIRYSGILLFFSSGIFAVVENGQYNKDHQRFNEIKGDLVDYLPPDFTAAQSKMNTSAFLTGLGYVISVAGACGFSWSFTF